MRLSVRKQMPKSASPRDGDRNAGLDPHSQRAPRAWNAFRRGYPFAPFSAELPAIPQTAILMFARSSFKRDHFIIAAHENQGKSPDFN